MIACTMVVERVAAKTLRVVCVMVWFFAVTTVVAAAIVRDDPVTSRALFGRILLMVLVRAELGERHLGYVAILDLSVSQTLFAYFLLAYLALVAPVEVEQIELGLATRKAHFAFGYIVEQLIVEEQVVQLGLSQYIAYVAELFERELQAIAFFTTTTTVCRASRT